MGKSWSGHPDYPIRYEWPEDEQAAAPPDMPPMTSVFEFAPDAFQEPPCPSLWQQLWRWWRR